MRKQRDKNYCVVRTLLSTHVTYVTVYQTVTVGCRQRVGAGTPAEKQQQTEEQITQFTIQFRSV